MGKDDEREILCRSGIKSIRLVLLWMHGVRGNEFVFCVVAFHQLGDHEQILHSLSDLSSPHPFLVRLAASHPLSSTIGHLDITR